jgi:hypothetical protein
MSADEKSLDDAQASAERREIVELLESGFLHVHSYSEGEPWKRLAAACCLRDRIMAEGRDARVLHRQAVTRVYATRPKRREPANG